MIALLLLDDDTSKKKRTTNFDPVSFIVLFIDYSFLLDSNTDVMAKGNGHQG